MKTYWASEPTEQVGGEIEKRISAYYEHLDRSGRLALWKRAYHAYYQGVITGGSLQSAGSQDELTSIKIGHLRNILQHIITMTISQRPSFEPRATNTDYKSQAQTILAGGLLEYYLREKRLERHFKQATEYAALYAEGILWPQWNSTLGEAYGVDPSTQEIVNTGDIEYCSLAPIDVVRNHKAKGSEEHSWFAPRRWENRWDLAARYASVSPSMADDIINYKPKAYEDDDFINSTADEFDDDLVPVYTFMHAKTKALPHGRLVKMIDRSIVLEDSLAAGAEFPYPEIPLYRIAPGEQDRTPFGYSVGYDLLPVQNAFDGLVSVVLTNQSTFGVQNIWVKSGSDLGVSQLSGKLNVIKSNEPPQALNLTSTPPEIFNFISLMERAMETISGVNSVARGNPEASLKSGSALALVQSQALAFATGLQQSYAQLLEDVGTATIKILQRYAKAPRVAMIAGKTNRPAMKEFTGDDLAQISRVTVDMGNPVARTTAGRLQIAQDLLQNGLVKNAQQYLSVISTGKLEPVIEGEQAELLNIRAENELMGVGQSAVAVVTDNHPMHVMEHKVVLASPEARQNSQIVGNVTAHLQEHIGLMRSTDPMLLSMLGMQPPPPQMGPPPGPPMPGDQGGSMPGAPGDQMIPPPGMEGVPMPNQPRMPTNALTGEQAQVAPQLPQ